MAVELDHTILVVNDRSQSIDFYTRILGFTYEGAREPFAVVRVNPHLTLQLAAWGTAGGTHLAFAMTRAAFDVVFDRVRAAGVPYGDVVRRGGQHAWTRRRGRGPRRREGRLLLRSQQASDRGTALRAVSAEPIRLGVVIRGSRR